MGGISDHRGCFVTAPTGISWLTRSIVELAREQKAHGAARVIRYNPRPAGVMRPGCASEIVLVFLRAQPRTLWLPKWRIVSATGLSIKSADHALRFLIGQGLVKSAPDAQRNSRYLRYQAVIAVPAEASPA